MERILLVAFVIAFVGCSNTQKRTLSSVGGTPASVRTGVFEGKTRSGTVCSAVINMQEAPGFGFNTRFFTARQENESVGPFYNIFRRSEGLWTPVSENDSATNSKYLQVQTDESGQLTAYEVSRVSNPEIWQEKLLYHCYEMTESAQPNL